MSKLSPPDARLLAEVRQLIDAARRRVASAVNAELTLLYWQIGQRIRTETLGGQRAAYGKEVVATLSRQLTAEYGKGWSRRQLWYCVRMAEAFSDSSIVHAVRAELSWSHLRHCLRIAETFPDEKIVYALCRQFSWSHLPRTLNQGMTQELLAGGTRLV